MRKHICKARTYVAASAAIISFASGPVAAQHDIRWAQRVWYSDASKTTAVGYMDYYCESDPVSHGTQTIHYTMAYFATCP